MSSELNLSIGVSPRFFVRLDGWTDVQIQQLVGMTRDLSGVTSAAASAGSGMYVDYDPAVATDASIKQHIREAAATIVPGVPQAG